jgi:hypothetical protein
MVFYISSLKEARERGDKEEGELDSTSRRSKCGLDLGHRGFERSAKPQAVGTFYVNKFEQNPLPNAQYLVCYSSR